MAAKKKAKNAPKLFWIILGIVSVVILGGCFLHKSRQETSTVTRIMQPIAFDFGNQKVMLDDQEITFINGSYTSADKSQTARMLSRHVNPVGNRAAEIFSYDPGGSGTFIYLLGAMSKEGKETYSKPVLLGDRVKIVSVTVDDPGEHDNGVITVEYLDRTVDTPMAADLSKKVTVKYAFQDDGNLISVRN